MPTIITLVFPWTLIILSYPSKPKSLRPLVNQDTTINLPHSFIQKVTFNLSHFPFLSFFVLPLGTGVKLKLDFIHYSISPHDKHSFHRSLRPFSLKMDSVWLKWIIAPSHSPRLNTSYSYSSFLSKFHPFHLIPPQTHPSDGILHCTLKCFPLFTANFFQILLRYLYQRFLCLSTLVLN